VYYNNKKIPNTAPNKDKIAGNNFISIGKLNSASIKVTWSGWTKILLERKSDPTPTNKSENTKPKKNTK